MTWNLESAAGRSPIKQTNKKTPALKQLAQDKSRARVLTLTQPLIRDPQTPFRSTGDIPMAVVPTNITPMKTSFSSSPSSAIVQCWDKPQELQRYCFAMDSYVIGLILQHRIVNRVMEYIYIYNMRLSVKKRVE